MDVVFDRAAGDRQPGRNVLVLEPAGNEFGDFEFTR
jgi:hypothetical protein